MRVKMGSVPEQSGTLVIRSVADPAAADSFEIIAPAGVMMRVIAFRFMLVTDANVINRSVYYHILDATRVVFQCLHTTAQTAGQTMYYNVLGGYAQNPLVVSDQFYLPWPSNLIFARAYSIEVFAYNMQVADQFSDIAYAAEDWIGDL